MNNRDTSSSLKRVSSAPAKAVLLLLLNMKNINSKQTLYLTDTDISMFILEIVNAFNEQVPLKIWELFGKLIAVVNEQREVNNLPELDLLLDTASKRTIQQHIGSKVGGQSRKSSRLRNLSIGGKPKIWAGKKQPELDSDSEDLDSSCSSESE